MIFIFEIPIVFFVVLVLGILGFRIGPILITIGQVGLILGALLTLWLYDGDNLLMAELVAAIPSFLILLLGYAIGDAMLWNLLF